jgi:C1A family cysteine protease
MAIARPQTTGYGWKPDLPDFRDYKYGITLGKKSVVIPQTTDLRNLCSKVEDQGQLGSCTANALVGNLEFLENKTKSKFSDLSRLFVYYNERVLEGTVHEDSGAYLRDGIKALAKKGVCTESQWPYKIEKFATKPSMCCYIKAAKCKISSYTRLSKLDDMLHCLADGYPFVFGFTVYDYFESEEMAETGILKMPTAKESVLGGHAVMACGYDQGTKRILVRNSWGSDWGIQGYFWMPFDYISDTDLADDLWTIRK